MVRKAKRTDPQADSPAASKEEAPRGRIIERPDGFYWQGVGGTERDGSAWNSPVAAVIVAIQDGQSYFVLTPVEALLVSVYVDAAGRKRLKAGIDENDARLLRLARCA